MHDKKRGTLAFIKLAAALNHKPDTSSQYSAFFGNLKNGTPFAVPTNACIERDNHSVETALALPRGYFFSTEASEAEGIISMLFTFWLELFLTRSRSRLAT